MKHFFLIVCLSVALGAFANQDIDVPVFQTQTEDRTIGWAVPNEKLATSLVTFSDLNTLASDCIQVNGLDKNFRQFLVSKPLFLSKNRSKFLFVRPSSELYCGAFYGAHIFHFWIVDPKQRVIFSSSADEFEVLKSNHEGMRDLLVSSCHGGYCYRTTMMFSRGAYAKASCHTTELETNKTVPGCTLP